MNDNMIVIAASTDPHVAAPDIPAPVWWGPDLGGLRAEWKFDNGYGASVITFGGHGVELAVLDPSGDITYDTPVTDDIIGWIASERELIGLLRRIMAL